VVRDEDEKNNWREHRHAEANEACVCLPRDC
jgi:hypothetical protein